MSAPRWIRAAKAPATVPPPLAGAWAAGDTRLDRAAVLPLPDGSGPEDVAVDADGRLVAGDAEGRIWCWPATAAHDDRAAPVLLAETGGRPLGIELDPRDGSLVVCDAHRGLLRITADGTVTVLATEAACRPFTFCNNAAVAADGTVYFSDSSDRYPIAVWKRDLLEYRPNGRLLAYDGTTHVVAADLYFPNGVALTPDGSALMVVETSAHRLLRVDLPDGKVTVLADLPAYPDNMSPV